MKVAILKKNEIKEMPTEELIKKVKELRMELQKLRLRKELGTLDNPGKIRAIRRTIARILTELRSRGVKYD